MMKRVIFIFIFICILFFPYGNSAQIPRSTNPIENLEKELQLKLDELQQKEGFPGVTLGIVLPDGNHISLASGFADIELKKKMNPTDRMLMGSIGKTYVAGVALQLVKEKKFSLQDKISRFLREKKWFKRLPNAEDITIKMLMNHSGGLPRYVLKKELWKQLKESPDNVWKPGELIAFILDEKPLYPAGEGWAYTDTDYIILGMIIEKVTGNTYYEELKKRVLLPHNLKNTSPSDKRQLRGLVPGYTGDQTPPFFLPEKIMKDGVYVINPQFEWTGGGLITTSLDLAQYIKLLLEGKVISIDYLGMMKQPVNEKTGEPDTTGYGLGLEVWKTGQGITYGHRGTMPGYGSMTEYVPQYGFSIAMQINTDRLSGRVKSPINLHIAALKPIVVKYLTHDKD